MSSEGELETISIVVLENWTSCTLLTRLLITIDRTVLIISVIYFVLSKLLLDVLNGHKMGKSSPFYFGRAE